MDVQQACSAMASINPRKDRDSITIGWQAQVRRKGFSTQSRTFDKKGSAQAWARQVEGDMERGVFVATNLADKTALADALDRYAREVTSSKKGALQEFRRIEQANGVVVSTAVSGMGALQ